MRILLFSGLALMAISDHVAAVPNHLEVPAIYDNAEIPLEFGQSFIAQDVIMTGVRVYIGDPSRPNMPKVNELVGSADLVLYDATNLSQPIEIARSQIVPAGASLFGLSTLVFAKPVATVVGKRYAFVLSTSDDYGIGMRAQLSSTYPDGTEVVRDPSTGIIILNSRARDLSFEVITGAYSVTQSVPQPIYTPPPPDIVTPPKKSKNLVMLIHGWQSSPSAWASRMKTSIAGKLISKYSATLTDQSDQCDTVEATDAVWRVCVKDWSADARLTPPNAYVNASEVGEDMGLSLAISNYDFIHFIAHSAGSQVAEAAAKRIKHKVQISGYKEPEIHTTFLDAYDVSGNTSSYGENSDWAEQYVDSRPVFFNLRGLDDTRIILPNAYNFDITALDFGAINIIGLHAHAWPHLWYKDSVDYPRYFSSFGFTLSKAYGANPSHSNSPRGGRCVAESNTNCSGSQFVPVRFKMHSVTNDLLVKPNPGAANSTSPTGAVSLLNGTLKLITGSPVWIAMPFKLAEPVNFASFDYAFRQPAEGLLSVFFDDQLVYRADQRLDKTGATYPSDDVPLGKVNSGAHTLSFRLDAYNGTKSEIDISNVQLGNKQTVTDCLFDWAESNYPALFAPSGSPTAIWDVYTYRYYSVTNAYVGVSSADNHAYYMGPDGILQDEGPLSYWLPKAGCQ